MAAALAQRGHQVTILIPPYDNPAHSGQVWERHGVRLENAVIPLGMSGARLYWHLAGWLVSRVRQLRPDVVHVFKPVGVSALALWRLRRAPYTLVLDNDDWEGRGGWVDVNPYPLAYKLFMIWQERWALRVAPRVTCASLALLERTRAFRAGRDAHALYLFPNGPGEWLRPVVAQAEANREALRAQFGWRQPVVIYAGTVPLNHDLDIVVQALRAQPQALWVIVAAGEGLPALREAVVQAGIADRVAWYDFMPHDQLIARLVAADVAVYPYRDTPINRAKCSGKVIDYMVCGKPMVVSAVGMNCVYLEHARSALLTPPGDGEAFTSALARLLAEPEFASRLGRAAQQRIWEGFGWEGRAAALEQVYCC
jgi:glycosyltransferase involved in cell wall biosynthesis